MRGDSSGMMAAMKRTKKQLDNLVEQFLSMCACGEGVAELTRRYERIKDMLYGPEATKGKRKHKQAKKPRT